MREQELDELLLRLNRSMEAAHRAQMDLLEVVRKLVQEQEQPVVQPRPDAGEPSGESPKTGGPLKLRDTAQAAEFVRSHR